MVPYGNMNEVDMVLYSTIKNQNKGCCHTNTKAVEQDIIHIRLLFQFIISKDNGREVGVAVYIEL